MLSAVWVLAGAGRLFIPPSSDRGTQDAERFDVAGDKVPDRGLIGGGGSSQLRKQAQRHVGADAMHVRRAEAAPSGLRKGLGVQAWLSGPAWGEGAPGKNTLRSAD